MVDINNDISRRKSYAALFHLLSYDSCIDAVIPLKLAPILLQCLELGKLELPPLVTNVVEMADQTRFYNKEVVDLLHLKNSRNSLPEEVLLLIQYCCELVIETHKSDVSENEMVIESETYNPAKFGRAYSFTEHGCQVRKVRGFNIDRDREKDVTFDDTPQNLCFKKFPQVSKRGVSYLFLWFCPQHCHCYGFHVILGAEGRKDPAASLYTDIVKAPDVIMYDFCCGLSEYVHNRETGFFKNTRFFHDVFHTFTHKCTAAFRCNKLLGFDGVNSSICEQFNSFLQNIKTSAKLMSQTHFTFYMQFFIPIWNCQKSKSFNKKRSIAVSGELWVTSRRH